MRGCLRLFVVIVFVAAFMARGAENYGSSGITPRVLTPRATPRLQHRGTAVADRQGKRS